MLKITFFGTTTLLFDDGRDQILFDAHFTRPSIEKYIHGAFVTTNTGLCDKLIDLHHIDRLRAIFISHTHHEKAFFAETVEKTNAREKTEYVFFKLAKYCEAHDVNCLIQYPCTSIEI